MIDELPEFAFATEREAAAKLRDAAKAAGHVLYALPFSRFDPDRSTWWLSPDSANPAYAFGKIVVERPTIVDDGAKLIGLHVEKGVGPSAAPIFEESARSRRLVMQRDWVWHPFLRALRSGNITESAHEAAAAADGLPLVLEVAASLQPLPKLDDEDRPMDQDTAERIRYGWNEGTLSIVARDTPKLLMALDDTESLESIGEKIASMKGLNWNWVEILIGVPFRPVASGGLDAMQVWERVCAPWIRWLR
jgi:hypothetical protein